MNIELPKDIADAVQSLSRKSGVPSRKLVTDALRAHFPAIDAGLQEELAEWEAASDEDWLAVELKLQSDV